MSNPSFLMADNEFKNSLCQIVRVFAYDFPKEWELTSTKPAST